MSLRRVVAMLLAAVGAAAPSYAQTAAADAAPRPQQDAPATPRAQECEDAAREFEAQRDSAVPAGKEGGATPATRRLLELLQACYGGAGRVLAPPQRAGTGPPSAATAAPAPAAAPVAPSVPSAPGAPSVLTLCDAGGCWDNLGRRFHGTGSVLYGPNGKTCLRSGDMIECR